MKGRGRVGGRKERQGDRGRETETVGLFFPLLVKGTI
jgi:hypothetical protein